MTEYRIMTDGLRFKAQSRYLGLFGYFWKDVAVQSDFFPYDYQAQIFNSRGEAVHFIEHSLKVERLRKPLKWRECKNGGRNDNLQRQR